jgi:hypothetical protein
MKMKKLNKKQSKQIKGAAGKPAPKPPPVCPPGKEPKIVHTDFGQIKMCVTAKVPVKK